MGIFSDKNFNSNMLKCKLLSSFLLAHSHGLANVMCKRLASALFPRWSREAARKISDYYPFSSPVSLDTPPL